MTNLFNQKISLTIGITALLTSSLAYGYSFIQSRNEQLSQQPNIQENSPLSQQQTSLVSMQASSIPPLGLQHSRISQPIADNFLEKQKKPTSNPNTASVNVGYPVIDEWKNYKFSVKGSKILSPSKLPTTKVNFNQADLLTTLLNTRKYFQDHSAADPDVLRKGLLGTQGVSVEDILKTLDFMIATLREDIAQNRPTRLQDANFINSNFRVIKWTAYNKQSPKQQQLRLTKYAVFTHPGSHTKTAKFNTPIYSLNTTSSTDKFYTRYTKQDVLSGIYEPGGKEYGKVKPLAYLTRTGLEEALMQGTILINFTDGTKAFFNVDRNNGMSYIRGLKATSQKRYWYFKQVDAIKGYGHKIDAKISIKPGVTFAGDVLNIGLGRIVVIEHTKGGRKQLQMGVIADTGGAFLPNLYQLDYLAGIFQSQQQFRQHISKLPEYATAYFLVKK
jgi:hypothetical protein